MNTELRADRRTPFKRDDPNMWPWVIGVAAAFAIAVAGLSWQHQQELKIKTLQIALENKDRQLQQALNNAADLQNEINQLKAPGRVTVSDRSLPPNNYAVTAGGRVYQYQAARSPNFLSPDWMGQLHEKTRQAQQNLQCDHHRQRATLEGQRSNNAVNAHESALHRDRAVESRRYIAEHC